jgi:hypothetical protein
MVLITLLVFAVKWKCDAFADIAEFLLEYRKLENAIPKVEGFSDRFIVVKSVDDKILLVTFIDDSIRELPDKETAHEFGYIAIEALRVLPGVLERRFHKHGPMPSLKYVNYPRMSPDEMVRNKILKIMAIQPPTFIAEYIFLKGVINPAIIKLSTRTFVSWKTGCGQVNAILVV